MVSQTLFVLLVAACSIHAVYGNSGVSRQSVTSACARRSYQYQCDDGSCVNAAKRCDGSKNCRDGSDEQGCDALLSTVAVELPLYATITARVQFAWEHGGIRVALCGDQRCSAAEVPGVVADDTLFYRTYTGCNRFGMGGSQHSDRSGQAFRLYNRGEVVLQVQRLPGQLKVWRQNRPDDKVVVPVEADYGTLKIRPKYWSPDMPVQYEY